MKAKHLYLLALLVLVWAFAATVPARGLFEPDESRYALVARGMLQEGRWLVPYLEGKPYTHKPPLYLWMVAALARAGLPWTAAAVLPAFLPALALVLLFPGVATKFGLGRDQALWAGALLAASPLFATMAVAARMDMLLALFLTLALAAAFQLLQDGQRQPAPGAYWTFWLSLGLAVMSKGPVALALVGATLLLFAIASRERLPWRNLFQGWGWVVALGLPLAWLVPAALVEGKGWLADILVRQSAGRMVASFAHREPFYFHLATWPLTGFPTSLLGLFASLALLRRKEDPGVRFLAAAFLGIFGFFSLISGKLVVYLLPLVPVSVLLALRAVALARGWVRWGLALAALVALVLGAGLASLPFLRPELALPLAWVAVLAAGLLLAALLALVYALRGANVASATALAACGLWFAAVVLPGLTQALDSRLSVRPVALRYAQVVPSGAEGLVFREFFSGLPLYSGLPFRRLASPEELREALACGRPVVLTARDWERLAPTLEALPLTVERFPYRRSALCLLLPGSGPAAQGR